MQLDISRRQHSLGSIAGPSGNFTVEVWLSFNSSSIQSVALLDSGASSCFIDVAFAQAHGVPVVCLSKPIPVEAIDGRVLSSGAITQATIPLGLRVGSHQEELAFYLIASPRHPIVLGLTWLEAHNPIVDWCNRSITFSKPGSSCKGMKVNSISHPSEKVDSDSTTPPSVQDGVVCGAVSNTLHAIPDKYQDFSDVFEKCNADRLPEHRLYDCPIDLQEGACPPFGPLYALSAPELKALRVYLDENLEKGFIQPSKSPAGAPILFVKKKDGSLRLCVDYRGLNKLTVRNRYPLPLIPELLDRLRIARVFSKVDLRGAYNLVRIKPGDEWKTAFRTRYGHFEYKVMPFGLTNAPTVFQHMMNDIFREYLDHFVVIYLDDILIFSPNMEEHTRQVRLVLAKLREHGLYAKGEKCEFDRTSIEFLGYIISPTGITMDMKKVSVIRAWATPRRLKDVQSFLGFANFYRRFIKGFSTLAQPLIALTRKGTPFFWTPEVQNAFDSLKHAFITAPVLLHADPTKPFQVETDASDFAIGAILSQADDNNLMHPVAYYSRKFTASEINYPIYDKELAAIIAAFEEWRPYLAGAQHRVQVVTDHKNLVYFSTTRTLNRRQARWSTFLADYDFEIVFRPGGQHGKADALSRRADLALLPGDAAYAQQSRRLLKPDQLHLFATCMLQDDSLLQQITEASKTDAFANEIRDSLQNPSKATKRKDLDTFTIQEGLLFRDHLLYVPEGPCRTRVLRECHDDPLAGHFGVAKTLELITRGYWWPQPWKLVKEYIKSCEVCARSKAIHHRPYGLLQPLPCPRRPWASISMDLITDLPLVNSYDSVLVVVDRFTKMAHFTPCSKTISGEGMVHLLLNNVVRLHGLPDDVISDRGPQFVSHFWQRLLQTLGISVKLSSAYHPQTDGQTERVNQILEQYLRCSVSYQQDDWVNLLSLAEFAYNNSLHASTGVTPFFANYGLHPRFNISLPTTSVNPSAEDRARILEELHHDLSLELSLASERYKKQADRHRSATPHFVVGDMVWLLRRHISTTRPCAKLDYKKLGPFRIIECINPVAFRLALPSHFRIHDVFHVSLLEPHYASQLPGRQAPPPPPPVQLTTGEEYEVDQILDSRWHRRHLQYLVLWRGYPMSEATWEPSENLQNAPEVVQDFHHRYPHKPAATLGRRRRRGDNVKIRTLDMTML